MRPICIIPASGASTRFPRKNIALFNGKPLLAYAIDEALISNIFRAVYVSSEDAEILEMAQDYGGIPLLRPSELKSDRAQIRHVCLDILKSIVCKEFGVLGIPNPLRIAEDIIAAYTVFKQSDAECLMSVSSYAHPPQRAVWMPDGYIEPYFNIKYMLRAQKLDPVWRCDGSIIFVKTYAFKRVGDFYGTQAVPYFTPKERSIDIDYPIDLKLAEFLKETRNEILY